MSDVFKKIAALKSEHGFQLVRSTRHQVWKSREGVIWICASTPSDYRVAGNQLTSLRRAIREANTVEVIVISQFEREQADELIRGREKAAAGRAGAAGSRTKSRGSGYLYIDTSETRRLQEMSEADRAEYLRRKRETAEQAKAATAAAKAAKAHERSMVKDFLEYMMDIIARERQMDMDQYDGALTYEVAAGRSIYRALHGKKISLHKKPTDETYDAVYCAKHAIESLMEDMPVVIEAIQDAARTYSTEKEWAKALREGVREGRNPLYIPHEGALGFSLETMLANYDAWKMGATFTIDFKRQIQSWKAERSRDFDRMQSYIRLNTLDLITAPQATVHQNILADLGKKLQLDSYTGPDWACERLADSVIAWQKDYESRLLAKEPKAECQRVQRDRVEYAPLPPEFGLVELRMLALQTREKIRVMEETLDELDLLIKEL